MVTMSRHRCLQGEDHSISAQRGGFVGTGAEGEVGEYTIAWRTIKCLSFPESMI